MQHMGEEMDRHRRAMAPMMSDMATTVHGMHSHCDGLGLGEMDDGAHAVPVTRDRGGCPATPWPARTQPSAQSLP